MTTDDAAPDGLRPSAESDPRQSKVRALLGQYWAKNVRIMAALTAAWFVVGLGCGVLLADRLNAIDLPGTGYPLGFWFAQQGSIMGFVLIILAYCALMNRLDGKYHTELEALRKKQRSDS